MRPKHKTHKRANPSSGLFNQTVQSKRWLYRALVSLHPLLFAIGSSVVVIIAGMILAPSTSAHQFVS